MEEDIPFPILPNEHVVIDDVHWQVVDFFGDDVMRGATLLSEDGHKRPYRWSRLRHLMEKEGAYLVKVRIDAKTKQPLPPLTGSLDEYPPERVQAAVRRLKYCRAVELALKIRAPSKRIQSKDKSQFKRFRFTLTDNGFDVLAKRVARAVERVEGDSNLNPKKRLELREQLAPTGYALNDWYGTWRKEGRTLEALVPRDADKGKTGPRNKLAHEVMEDFADRYYLQPEQNDIPNVFSLACNEIRSRARAAGMDVHEAQALIPNERTFRRVIDDIDQYDISKWRENPNETDRRFKLKHKGPTYTRPLQAIQIDHTGLPIVARDPEDNLALKGVTCTFALDLYSRAPMGWYAGLEPPGWAPVQQALKMVMTPKSWLERYDNIKSAARVKNLYGVPYTIFSDMAAEFKSGSLRDAAGQLNFRALMPPPGSPNYRGAIERMFRRMKKSIFAGMPGRLFKDGKRKIEYDAAGNAILDFEQINWVLAKFFFDMFSIDWHDGIQSSPIVKWEIGAKKWGVRLAPDINTLIPLLATVVGERTIQHTGVEFEGLFYGPGSPALQALLNKYGPGGKNFKIKMDVFDVGQVFLLDPTSKRFITLECTDDEWKGRSLHSRRVAVYRASRKKATHQRLNDTDVDDAYAEVMTPSMAKHDARHARRTALERKRAGRARKPHRDPTTDTVPTKQAPPIVPDAPELKTTSSSVRPATRAKHSPTPIRGSKDGQMPAEEQDLAKPSVTDNEGSIQYVRY